MCIRINTSIRGDIISNKKTYLYLRAIQTGTSEEVGNLKNLFDSQPKDPSEKIKTTRQIFINSGSVAATEKAISSYTDAANTILDDINLPETHKQQLREFGKWLMTRRI